jgi:hypothetical protein
MGGMLVTQGRQGTLNEHDLLLQQQQLLRSSSGATSMANDAQNVQQMFSMVHNHQQQQQQKPAVPAPLAVPNSLGMQSPQPNFVQLPPELTELKRQNSKAKPRRRSTSKIAQVAAAAA